MRFPILLCLSAAWTLSAQQPLAHPENPVAGDLKAIDAGRKVYAGSCVGCHGPTGEGGRGPNLRDGRLIRRSTDFQVFNTIRKGVPGSDMPGVNLPDDQLWALVAFVRSMGAPASEVPVPGNATHGEEVYRSSGCSNCHAISGRGGSLGPDLSNIGASRSYGILRESLEKPGERLAAGYQPVTVKTRDGKTVTGVLKNYTNYDLQMTDKAGQLYIFKMSDVADVDITMKSLMPANFATRLSKDDMTDLLAYLSKLEARPSTAKMSLERRRGGQGR